MKKQRSWQTDYASPVKEYFEKGSNADICKLLMENSADSLRASLDQYNQKHALNSNFKYSILLLAHGVESLLKARLALNSEDSILQGNEKSKLKKTLGYTECLDGLKKIEITLESNFENALVALHHIRNDIWHFGFLGRKAALDDLIGYCSCIYWVFLMRYLPEYGIREMLMPHQFELLMGLERKVAVVKGNAAEIMNKWHDSLPFEQERFHARICDECHTLSVIIDKQTRACRCRCCGHKPDFDNFRV